MSNKIIVPKVVMSWKSEGGYHTFNCPACDQRNKAHERRAINYVEPKMSDGGTVAIDEHWKGDALHFSCVGCHRTIHVTRCPVGGLIVL